MPSPTTVLLRTQSDERLVALARGGHERAFEAIVERYRRPLVRACRRVLPEARAEDAVQQALVAAWTGLRRGDEVRALRPWLYRIAHNTALNQLRVSGYDYDELNGLLMASGPAPDEELERRHVARRTLTGLAALPERQREALLQTAVQGRGQEEVAQALGISEPAVRQLVHRARTQLRSAVTALTPMPLAGWLADLGARSGPVNDRIGELVAGGGSAGVAATVAKVGAVVVLAGGAAASPGVVDRLGHGGDPGAAPALGAAEARAAEPAKARRAPAAYTVRPAATPASSAPGRVSRGSAGSSSRHGPERRDSGETTGSSGRRETTDRRERDDPLEGRHRAGGDDGSRDSTRSGTLGDDAETSGEGTSGGGEAFTGDESSGTSGTSGSDDGLSGGDDGAASMAAPTPTPTSTSGTWGGGDAVPDDRTETDDRAVVDSSAG